jgi:site-specific recombinase XerD
MRTATKASVGDLGILAEDFERHLRAGGRSDKTRRTYLEAVNGLDRFLAASGMPRKVESIAREHLESYIVDLLDRWTEATANNRYRSLKQFFKWLVEEGEITTSPMANMDAPKIPERRPPVLTDKELAKLIEAAHGNSFVQRRDTALLRALIDTGARAGEVVGLTVKDVDLDAETLRLVGKRNRERLVNLGPGVLYALGRYFRARRQHKHRELPWLWIGERGRLTDSGLRQLLERIGERAGVKDVHAHRFRHAAADAWLKAEGSEDGLMSQMGWRSRSMVQRYAAANRQDRARAEHKRLAPGERV